MIILESLISNETTKSMLKPVQFYDQVSPVPQLALTTLVPSPAFPPQSRCRAKSELFKKEFYWISSLILQQKNCQNSNASSRPNKRSKWRRLSQSQELWIINMHNILFGELQGNLRLLPFLSDFRRNNSVPNWQRGTWSGQSPSSPAYLKVRASDRKSAIRCSDCNPRAKAQGIPRPLPSKVHLSFMPALLHHWKKEKFAGHYPHLPSTCQQ